MFLIVTLLFMVHIMKAEGLISFVVLIAVIGSLLEHQDLLTLNFILVDFLIIDN